MFGEDGFFGEERSIDFILEMDLMLFLYSSESWKAERRRKMFSLPDTRVANPRER